ncbi:hypothetical protein AB6A40_006138 [Gnathostoma spinigerum]|uniref:Alanine--tRNA ligase n=1 Tax=Gnathostoma spinigerum TaxID=75299 RepID=A0ABD6EQ51_9BILA
MFNSCLFYFKSIFLGTTVTNSPLSRLRRAVSSQKCIRVGGKHNDFDDVGRDLSHHSLFEMLGNWSFGDYYKKEACEFALEYLLNVLRLPPDNLYVTYFAGDENLKIAADEECRKAWEKLGIASNRILPFTKADNFWEVGEEGPCGPSSEIHFDFIGKRDASSLVNRGDPSVIEIWNLVFMQYCMSSSGCLFDLPKRHVDTGLGLERITAIIQNVTSNYDTDIFIPIIKEISKYARAGAYSGKTGDMDRTQADCAYRILADHLRTVCVIISHGVIPDASERGFILRKMLRRMFRVSAKSLLADHGMIANLIPFVAHHMNDGFPEVTKNIDKIQQIISSEEGRYWKVIEEGKKAFDEFSRKLLTNTHIFPGDLAWKLHNERGLSIEVTEELANKQGLVVDMAAFNECRMKAKEEESDNVKNRYLSKIDLKQLIATGIPPTDDNSKYSYRKKTVDEYAFPVMPGLIVALFDSEGSPVPSLPEFSNGCVLVNSTNFYAEQGGQLADVGVLLDLSEESRFFVENVQRRGQYVFLIGFCANKPLTVGEEVNQLIDIDRRLALMRGHTATHALHSVMRHVAGKSMSQKGSLVECDRIRFDYTISEQLSSRQLSQIEEHMLDVISRKNQVNVREISVKEALDDRNVYTVPIMKISHLSKVRIIDFDCGDSFVSSECCCGTHLLNTADLMDFVVIADGSLKAGARRMIALTGRLAIESRKLSDKLYSRLNSLDQNTVPLSDLYAVEKDLKRQVVPLNSLRELRDRLKVLKKKAIKRRKTGSTLDF